jgi:hypothetical protein
VRGRRSNGSAKDGVGAGGFQGSVQMLAKP